MMSHRHELLLTKAAESLMRVGVIGLVLMCLASGADAAGLSESRKNCALKWPGNDGLKQACHRNNMAARKALKKLKHAHGPTVAACERLNPGSLEGIDYSAALQCVRMELKRQRRK